MREQFIAFLQQYDKKIISLSALEAFCPGDFAYDLFRELVMELVAAGVLMEYGKQRSARDARLCLKYRLQLYQLRQGEREEIQADCLRGNFPPLMDLSYYFQAGLAEWRRDYPWLQQIASYLRMQGLPEQEATDQERSYQIFGDEKVLLQGGRGIFRKLRLEEQMRLSNFPDPLMVAVQPERLQQGPFYHLIVENKATYAALLVVLPQLPLASLVYGAGWKIVGNVTHLPMQLGLAAGEHHYYYFGDIDEEGLTIWQSLQAKQQVLLALPFYQLLLTKSPSWGKVNQSPNIRAREQFFACFSAATGLKLRELLAQHGYYPQEGLNTEELLDSGRRLAATWT